MKKIIMIIFIAISSFSNASENKIGDLNAKDFSLALCLSKNYNKLNRTGATEINNDASMLTERYTPNDWDNIIKFVEDNTSDYYKEVVIMHFEEGPDEAMNIIFSKCMKFYHSKKMSEFIKRNKY